MRWYVPGKMRFRAILLTSLTTFFGLVPIMFETSLQAQFVIPMAVSLSFAVLFATLITLGWCLASTDFGGLQTTVQGMKRRLFSRNATVDVASDTLNPPPPPPASGISAKNDKRGS